LRGCENEVAYLANVKRPESGLAMEIQNTNLSGATCYPTVVQSIAEKDLLTMTTSVSWSHVAMIILRISFLLCSFVVAGVVAEETNTPSANSVTTNVASGDVTSNTAPSSITIDGTTYEDVRWGRLTPTTVTIYHRTGIATVPLASLPPDLQKQFGYDPDKAAAWQASADKTAAAKLAADQKAAAAREAADRKAAEQKAAADKAATAKANADKQKAPPPASSTSTNAVPKKRTITNPAANLPRTY
jgi:hypothetical protein